MNEFEKILADRLEGWEIVDFLQISSEEIIAAFEDRIYDNREDLEDFCGLRQGSDDDE